MKSVSRKNRGLLELLAAAIGSSAREYLKSTESPKEIGRDDANRIAYIINLPSELQAELSGKGNEESAEVANAQLIEIEGRLDRLEKDKVSKSQVAWIVLGLLTGLIALALSAITFWSKLGELVVSSP